MASAYPTIELAVALSLLPVLAWGAGPALSGTYAAEPLGRLELSTDGDRVTGLAAPGGACRFDGRRRVLEGVLEDGVLVGTLTLCQTGSGCAREQAYPLLAVYNATEGWLAAHVKLQPGCQSPALPKDARLSLQRVASEEAVESAGGPASQVARRREQRRPSSKGLNQWLRDGGALYHKGDYVQAAEYFEAAISLDERNALAFHGLGASLLMQGQERKAIEALRRARRLDGSRPETHYLLACAYGRTGERKQGLNHLRQAVRLGYPVDSALLSRDRDLQNLLGSDAELQVLVQQVRGRKQTQHRERQDSSDP